MRTDFLPLPQLLIGEEEIAEVADTLRSDWIVLADGRWRIADGK